MSVDRSSGTLLLVIPPVVELADSGYALDGDFANNLRAYLRSFGHVTVACPAIPQSPHNGLVKTVPFSTIEDRERLTFIPLPYTYREDRHLIHYLRTRAILREEVQKADYLLFSPHAVFDWSTLAAKIAISTGRSFDMEADGDGYNISRLQISKMPFGLKKVRQILLAEHYKRVYLNCLSKSSVALLQGQEVFDAYSALSPNPRKVLNVQVTQSDIISPEELDMKLKGQKKGLPITITYAGRAIERKGPLDWLNAIHWLIGQGIELHATWYGEGPLLPEMQETVTRLGIGLFVDLAGAVPRSELMLAQRRSDIFMFCHKAIESPRCLVEALACGCPIVGYGSPFARDLVAERGGGEFVEIDDWQGLAAKVAQLVNDRAQLVKLTSEAAHSARLYDRDSAIQHRIDLIKKFVKPPIRSLDNNA